MGKKQNNKKFHNLYTSPGANGGDLQEWDRWAVLPRLINP